MSGAKGLNVNDAQKSRPSRVSRDTEARIPGVASDNCVQVRVSKALHVTEMFSVKG